MATLTNGQSALITSSDSSSYPSLYLGDSSTLYPDEQSQMVSTGTPVYMMHSQVAWTILVQSNSASNYSLIITTTPIKCQRPNYTLSACPAANGYATIPYTSTELETTDGLMQFVFLFIGSSVSCLSTFKALVCIGTYPICDSNNFASDVCVGNTCKNLNGCNVEGQVLTAPTDPTACAAFLNGEGSPTAGASYVDFSAGSDCVALPNTAFNMVPMISVWALVLACAVALSW